MRFSEELLRVEGNQYLFLGLVRDAHGDNAGVGNGRSVGLDASIQTDTKPLSFVPLQTEHQHRSASALVYARARPDRRNVGLSGHHSPVVPSRSSRVASACPA